MNRIHRIVFNRAKGVAQAVSEVATAARGGADGSASAVASAAPSLPARSAVGLACLLAMAALAGAAAGNAWADGGSGGNGRNLGAGGTGGTSATPAGGAGGAGTFNGFVQGGGGGGGGMLANGDGASGGSGGGAAPVATGGAGGATGRRITSGNTTISAATTGGNGTAGAEATTRVGPFYDGGGGGGGGGGAGIASSSTGTLAIGANVSGGRGGDGGASGKASDFDPNGWGYGGAGGGGQGGIGLMLTGASGAVTVNAGMAVRGGDGGNGGAATAASGGNGGDGGIGVRISGSRTLTNLGTIAGGSGGAGGAATQGGPAGAAGARGAGIVASGGVTVINRGTIATGAAGAGASGDAIRFNGGGTNTLQVEGGSVITGNVVATAGGTDRLILGGTGPGTFDASAIGASAQYRNFASYLKNTAATWTLTGTTTAVTPWSVSLGVLSIASDGSLGDASGALALSGGATLATTATTGGTRNVSLGTGGGIFNTATGTTYTLGGVVSGAGRLTKQGAGALVLTGPDTYTGGTTISAGTLQLGDGGTSGAITGTVANAGTLVFNRSDALALAGVISGAGSVRQAGSGTTTLSGTNTYTGGTTVSGGTLAVSRDQNLGGAAGPLALDNGSLQTTASFSSARAVSLLNTGGTINTNAATALTLSGVVSGAGRLTKSGAGTLTLGNAANTYQGGTLVTGGGTLAVASDGRLGAAAGGIALDGGTLQTTANFTSARALALGSAGGGINTNASTTLTLGNTASGTGGLNKLGAGTLVLSGSNTYQGGTTVSLGTLSIAADANLGNAAGGLALNGGTLLNSATLTSGRAVALGAGNGSFNTATSTTLTLGGVVSGTGRLTKVGAGTLVLGGNNLYAGGTTVTTGILSIASDANLGDALGALALNGGTLQTTASTASVRPVTLTGTAGGFNIGSGTTLALGGQVSGTGRLTKLGAGNLALASGNTYTGGTSISAGTVTIASDDALGGAGALALAGGGTLAGTTSFASTRSISLGTGGGSIDTASGTTLTASGVISGGNRLTKLGTGTLVLTGTNTYSGGTTITQGTLQIGNGGATGAIAGSVVNGGSLVFNRTGALALSGVISGAGSVRQVGSGTTTLSGTNTYTGGTTISGGALAVSRDQNLGGAGGLLLDNGTLQSTASFSSARAISLGGTGGSLSPNAGTTLTLTGLIAGTGRLTLAGPGVAVLGNAANSYQGGTLITGGGTLSVAGDTRLGAGAGGLALDGGTLLNTATFSSARTITLGSAGGGFSTNAGTTLTLTSGASGPGGLNKTGTGTLVLAGNNSYQGGTTITAGTLQVGAGGTAGAITGDVANSGTLSFNRANDISFDGDVSGSGRLVKQGANTLVLTGDNSYGGGISFTAGTLQIGDGGASGSLAGNVSMVGGALVFNRTGTTVYAGNASGGGRLVQSGPGTTVLSGTSSYTGGTTISAGTLQLGDGGTSGWVAGNMANNGTLAFNRSDDISFAGAITGSGGVSQIGSGTTTLTGTSNYGGTTTVSAGILQVDGAIGNGAIDVNGAGTLQVNGTAGNGAIDVSGAGTLQVNGTAGNGAINVSGNGALQVNGTAGNGIINVSGAGALQVNGSTGTGAATIGSGATLSGRGTLGGAVAVLDGGTLEGRSGQTLHTGALTLASGATIQAALGTPGGAALFDVHGALTLDGTVNVSDLGGYGAGIYRLMSYSSTLVDHELEIGSAPAGSALSVQTAVAGQVNLVNTAGQTLAYWDGSDPAHLNNDAVDGGNGSWRATGGNWTNASGALNAPMAPQPGFAVFQSQAGTVTVDGSQGAVAVTGMQFATDGYVVQGDAIELTGAHAIVRVGDGSAAAMTATIDAALTGAARLEKTDSGRLVLTGANNYAGGTLVSGGMLQLGDGGTRGSIVGDVANNGALAFNRSDRVIFGGAISGSGAVVQMGSGTTTLTADNSYTGGTRIAAGTLELGNGGTSGSIVGNVLNAGTLAFNRSDAVVFAGAITGSGAIDQRGSGTTTLTAANSYGGGTTISAGTLQLGNGGSSGSITGDVVNQGTLAFKRSDDVVFAGAISGNGALDQRGSGTTALTAANSYGGGTTISAGTLQLGNGGTSGAITGDVANHGTLAFNRTDDVVFAGAISGNGAIDQRGSGTTTLTSANSYTGGTTISAGTLQLGNGGTSGAITGDVANHGTLAFNRSDDVVFAGAISGSGAVAQRGSGSTTLAGSNSYSGGTTIGAGQLVGSAGSFGSGPILNQGALEIRQAADASFANAMSGNGRFTKSGAGALDLTGDSSAFTGSTQVSAGTLAVNGTLGGSLTLAGGTTLKGNGTVGNTLVQAGATVAPGNSIGTLHVAGNLTLAPGATYQVEAQGDGQADRIQASGAITVQGASVSVLATGNWNPVTTYTIVSAGGGVIGRFGGVSTNLAFLDPTLSYDGQGIGLQLQRNDVSFESVASTPNQRAVAQVVEKAGNPLYSAIVQLDAPTSRSAFDQLSGQVHASLKSMAIEDSRFVRDAGIDRLRQALGGMPAAGDLQSRGNVWARAYGSRATFEGNGDAAETDRSTSGLFIGADTRVADDWQLGALAGYSHSDTRLDALASSATTDSYHVGVYGGRQWGALGLRAGAAYSDGSVDTQRSVNFTGLADRLDASYHAQTTQAFGELGWKLDAGAAAVEPFAGLAHVNLRTGAFTETGGTAALSADASRSDTTFSTLGLRASMQAGTGAGTAAAWTLRGMVGWRHAFGDVAPAAALALAGQPAFTVAGVPLAKDVAVIEAGADVALARDVSLGLSYAGQVGSGVRDHGVRANLLWKF